MTVLERGKERESCYGGGGGAWGGRRYLASGM